MSQQKLVPLFEFIEEACESNKRGMHSRTHQSPTGSSGDDDDGNDDDDGDDDDAADCFMAVSAVVPVTAARTVAYLAQHKLLEQIPQLRGDISEPPEVRRLRGLIGNGSTAGKDTVVRLWIGGNTSITPLHFDRRHNILCQVHGAKVVFLYRPASNGDLRRSFYPQSSFGGESNVSSVDIENLNFELYPDFPSAPDFCCHLVAGDALVIPEGWWHAVKSLQPSISVNFWW